jgi:hypothetical protein
MSCVVSFPDLGRGASGRGPKLCASRRENRGKEEKREGERRREKREKSKENGKVEEAIRLEGLQSSSAHEREEDNVSK